VGLHAAIYRENFNTVDRVYGSTLHGGRCAACCKAYRNFADESACLTADNIRNEEKFLPLFTDHRRCWKLCPSTRRHSLHRWKRFRFTIWSCSAGIFAIYLRIFSLKSSAVRGLLLQTLSFEEPQKKKSQELRLEERAGQIPLLTVDTSVCVTVNCKV
jgi:hypothetical protein